MNTEEETKMAMTPEELQELTDRVRRIRAVTRKQPTQEATLLPEPEPKPEEKKAEVEAEDDLDREAERRADLHHNRLPPYFSQTPDELNVSKRVSLGAKQVYTLMHKHAGIKHLNRHPEVRISQEQLGEDMGRSVDRIRIWIDELVKEGWIGKHRRGKMLVNQYTLYPRSKKTWLAYVSMERVQVRIARDEGLRKRLQASIHPLSP